MDTDPQFHPDPSPFNAVPAPVLAIFFAVFGIECLFAAAEAGLIGGPGGIGWRLQAIQDYGFSALVLDWMWSSWQFPPEHLLRFISYPLIHAGFIHMLLAGVIFLAMGKFVAGAMGGWTVPVLFFGCSVLGALVYALVAGQSRVPLIGAYPGTYGLIGAYTFVLWVHARATGQAQVQAFSLIGILMALQLLFGALFGGDLTWVADIAGALAGFVLSFVLVPGGLAFLLRKLRGQP